MFQENAPVTNLLVPFVERPDLQLAVYILGLLWLHFPVIPPPSIALEIVDGNPLEDIALLGDPEKNLKVIMKNGKIYKNSTSLSTGGLK